MDLYVVTRPAAGTNPAWMPRGWDGRWHAVEPYGTWIGTDVYCYGNGTDCAPTAVWRLTDRTEERSDGEIACVWELHEINKANNEVIRRLWELANGTTTKDGKH